jgi:hypothetical protein
MPARRKWEKEYTRSLNMSFSRTKTGTQATFCPKYKKKRCIMEELAIVKHLENV